MQQVPISSVKTSERAFDVSVEEAKQILLRDQRRYQARALFDGSGALGPMPQARLAGAVCFGQPRRDGVQQLGSVLAERQKRAGVVRF